MNWPVFFRRLGSAIIFSAVMMAGLLYPDPIAIFCLALLIQFLCLREFLQICKKIFPDTWFPRWINPATQLAGIVVMYCLTFVDKTFAFAGLLIPALFLLPATLSRRTALKAAFSALVALMYISIPMGLLVALRGMHIALPVALILMIWMNDTMAYLTGSFIGRTPFSAISPKKTWEGTIGGVVFTLASAAIWAKYNPYNNAFYFYDWIIIAFIVCIAGTAGDLFESKLKRMEDIKDSGNLMPGHGGALDRFDSLLMSVPFVFSYLWLMIS